MDKYQPLEKIGQGQFGTVRKIKRIADDRILAWKQIQYGSMSREQKNQLVNQVNILKELHHENIVKYYEHLVYKKNSKIFIVMEYCPGGDLVSVLKENAKHKQYISEDIVWKLFFQLVQALHYCHKKKILHRDLKPANIFIDNTRSNVKIGDFGLSKQLGQHSQYARTYVGTPYYMSPQQISNIKYNQKSDIWSLGCIIYEISSMTKPFLGSSIIQLSKNIQTGKFKPLPHRYSHHLQSVIARMLSTNPDLRPSTSQLLALPFMAIRVEEREARLCYEELRRKEEELKKKEEELRERVKILKESVGPIVCLDGIGGKSKKNQSVMENMKNKTLKSLTISI